MISYKKNSILSLVLVTCAMPLGWIASPIIYSTPKSSLISSEMIHIKPQIVTF